MSNIFIKVLRSENIHLNSISRACVGFSAPRLTLKQFINESFEAANILPRVEKFYGEEFDSICQMCELLVEENGKQKRVEFKLEPLADRTTFEEWVDFIKEETSIYSDDEDESVLLQVLKDVTAIYPTSKHFG